MRKLNKLNLFLTKLEYVVLDEEGNKVSWEKIDLTLQDVYNVMLGKGSACCMDTDEDHQRFLSALLEKCNERKEEKKEMQEVPDDAILLTPEEAQAIVDYLDEVRYPDEEEPLASAIRALDEQLEYDYDDVD